MQALKFNCKLSRLLDYGFNITGEFSAKKMLFDSEEFYKDFEDNPHSPNYDYQKYGDYYEKNIYDGRYDAVYTEELVCIGNEELFIFIHTTKDFNFDNIIRTTDVDKIKKLLPKEIIAKCVEVIEIDDYPVLKNLSINGVFEMRW